MRRSQPHPKGELQPCLRQRLYFPAPLWQNPCAHWRSPALLVHSANVLPRRVSDLVLDADAQDDCGIRRHSFLQYASPAVHAPVLSGTDFRRCALARTADAIAASVQRTIEFAPVTAATHGLAAVAHCLEIAFSRSAAAMRQIPDSSPSQRSHSLRHRLQRKWQIFFQPPQNPPFFCYNRFIK